MKKQIGWIIAAMLSLGLVAVGCSSSKSAEKKQGAEEEAAQGEMAEEGMAEEEAGEEEAAQEEMAEEEATEEAAAEESGPAIGGYCPVAYKMAGKPVKGQEKFAVEHDGKTWYLANEKAMKAFKEKPEDYEVKYAGWCATGLAMGKEVKADPTIFMVHKEKIYLFSSEEAKKKFKAKADEMAKKAESNWMSMHSDGGDMGMKKKGEEEGAKEGGEEAAEEGAKEGM